MIKLECRYVIDFIYFDPFHSDIPSFRSFQRNLSVETLENLELICQDFSESSRFFNKNLLENFELKIERKFWKDFNYPKLVFHTVFDKKYSNQNTSNRRLIIIMRCLDMFGQVYVF